MKLGILREEKIPADSRVPLTPGQCRDILQRAPFEICVQPYPSRCYSDDEYRACGLGLCEDLHRCDVILGVKEVPPALLIPHKTYLFFSHTIKEQPHNRKLLQTILEKHIRLIDYEVLTDEEGERLIAFGKFAGMVGAHNALYTYGQRSGAFQLPRMKDCRDYEEAKAGYRNIAWPALKIALTGTGRVGNGAAQVLRDMGIREVDAREFLENEYPEAVFVQLHAHDYVARKDQHPFERRHYHAHPEAYQSTFAPFAQQADIFINGIYWDNRAPAFFTLEEMRRPDFRISVIADITCDIAPEASVPSTIRASNIEKPVYGFDPKTGAETAPYQPHSIDVMAIDNLPNEMPRDASAAFGTMFIGKVLPEFFKSHSLVLERATIAEGGQLGKYFQYLQHYVQGE